MDQDKMTEQITRALERGIRDAFEQGDVEPFRRAAVESYRLRTRQGGLREEMQIAHHVLPSDVEQTVRLGLQIAGSDREKASVLMKGALDQVLNRLATVPDAHWKQEVAEGAQAPWWKFWKR